MQTTVESNAPAYTRAADGPPSHVAEPWSLLNLFGFRFLFLAIFFTTLPGSITFDVALTPVFDAITASLGIVVAPSANNGAGDQLGSYVWLGEQLIAALVGACVWMAIQRRRTAHSKLDQWMAVLIRLNLASTLWSYGVIKVFPAGGQFPFPSFHRLLTPVGNLSPASLMWTFMGASQSYKFFAGSGELVAALLLLHWRTATLGAIVAAGVMANVVMMNFAYDVGVKVFSSTLLLMALILVVRDWRRLLGFFVTNRPIDRLPRRPLFETPLYNRIAVAATAILFAFQLGDGAYRAAREKVTFFGAPVALTGIYDVELMLRNRDTLPPLATDNRRWRTMAIEPAGVVTIQYATDSVHSYIAAIDTVRRAITVVSPASSIEPRFNWRYQSAQAVRDSVARAVRTDSSPRMTFAYQRMDGDRLVLRGLRGTDSVTVRLRRRDNQAMVLTSWQTHARQEYPYSDTWIEAPYDGMPADPRSRRLTALPLP